MGWITPCFKCIRNETGVDAEKQGAMNEVKKIFHRPLKKSRTLHFEEKDIREGSRPERLKSTWIWQKYYFIPNQVARHIKIPISHESRPDQFHLKSRSPCLTLTATPKAPSNHPKKLFSTLSGVFAPKNRFSQLPNYLPNQPLKKPSTFFPVCFAPIDLVPQSQVFFLSCPVPE